MNNNSQFQKIYVNVNLDSDSAGFIHPRSITMENGQVFTIEKVIDYKKADEKKKVPAACYCVMINGMERHLFLEKSGEFFPSSFGRWFVAKRK